MDTAPTQLQSLADSLVPILHESQNILAQHRASQDNTTIVKGDGTLVTRADHLVEEHLYQYISHRFPNDSIVAEERTIEDGSTNITWVIDPIDGTRYYTH